MSGRSKIISYSLLAIVMVWIGWHLVVWTTRGLGSLVKHEQTVYTKWKLKRQIQKIEPWTASTNYSTGGWEQLVKTAKAFQNTTPKVAADTLNDYLRRYARNPNQLPAEQGKVFLLLRIVFELPASAPVGQRLTFASWTRGRSDLNKDGTINLSWPLSWDQGKPRLVAGCEGTAGSGYSAGDEFASLRYKFKYRDLAKVPW